MTQTVVEAWCVGQITVGVSLLKLRLRRTVVLTQYTEDGVRGSTRPVPKRVVEEHRKEPDCVTVQPQPMVAIIVPGQLPPAGVVIRKHVQAPPLPLPPLLRVLLLLRPPSPPQLTVRTLMVPVVLHIMDLVSVSM